MVGRGSQRAFNCRPRHCMPIRKRYRIIGSDQLVTRVNGEWAQKKLAFLDHFGPLALTATRAKHRRVFVDLFAGPGRNATDEDGGTEFVGSAIRALSMQSSQRPSVNFTDAFLFNLNKLDHLALEERVGRAQRSGAALIPADRTIVRRCDANAAIPELLSDIHPQSYVFVFADCEAPRQWPWSSVEALCAQQHESVDLYMLFPLEMGLNRLFSWEEGGNNLARVLTRFFGCEDWRAIAGHRVTASRAPRLRNELLDLYLERLRGLWTYAYEVMAVRLRGRQGLYRMLFATNHDAGERIAKWAKRRANADEQIGMGF